MTDLRKAAEMALEALHHANEVCLYERCEDDFYTDEINALRQALAQPEQEAFNRLIRIMGTFDLATGHADSWEELLDSLDSELRDVLGHLRARREWVGLTEADIYEAMDFDDEFEFARAIEAKLKEKNGG